MGTDSVDLSGRNFQLKAPSLTWKGNGRKVGLSGTGEGNQTDSPIIGRQGARLLEDGDHLTLSFDFRGEQANNPDFISATIGQAINNIVGRAKSLLTGQVAGEKDDDNSAKQDVEDSKKTLKVAVSLKRLPTGEVIARVDFVIARAEKGVQALGNHDKASNTEIAQNYGDSLVAADEALGDLENREDLSVADREKIKELRARKNAVARILLAKAKELIKAGKIGDVKLGGLEDMVQREDKPTSSSVEPENKIGGFYTSEDLLALFQDLANAIKDNMEKVEKAFEEAAQDKADMEKEVARRQQEKALLDKQIAKLIQARLRDAKRGLEVLAKQVAQILAVINSPTATKGQIIGAMEQIRVVLGKLDTIKGALKGYLAQVNEMAPSTIDQSPNLTEQLTEAVSALEKIGNFARIIKSWIEARS